MSDASPEHGGSQTRSHDSMIGEFSGSQLPGVEPTPPPKPPLSDHEIAGVWVVIITLLLPSIFARMPPVLVGWMRYEYWDHLSGIMYVIGDIALVWFILWRSHIPWREVGVIPRFHVRDLVAVCTIVGCGYLLYSYAVQVVDGSTTWEAQWRQSARRPVGVLSWTLLVSRMLTAAFAEELVFRGFLFTRLEKGLRSRWWAMGLSSFLFGAIHLSHGLTGAFGAFLFGLVCSATFMATRNLWTVTLGHVAFNTIWYVVFQLEPEVTLPTEPGGLRDGSGGLSW